MARLAVTPGDPRGIGPEVACSALGAFAGVHPESEAVLLGPDGPLSEAELVELAAEHRAENDDARSGAFAAKSIEGAVRRALAGELHGIVTAPLHKPSLHAAGWRVPGQTEMLAQLSEVSTVGMLMCAERTRLDGPLRVLLVTTHLALRDVADHVTVERLVDQVALLDRSLRTDWGIDEPRIGLCALNPHASDGGLFGDEEARVFAPALETLVGLGVRAMGPLPADTVFTRALAGELDAVAAPYHDVGMAAFKTVSFGAGVNVTLGLPFVRTSPDHGTAFDIAGTGRASSSSMAEALSLAHRLAERRFSAEDASFDTSSVHS